MPAPAPSADRNLLFGILAVQLDFITKDSLIGAMNAWLLDKATPLGDILRDQGHLSAERLQLLAALVTEHLKQHGGDPQRSLAALSSIEMPLKQRLAALPDAAVQASLVQVGVDRAPPPIAAPVDPFATLAQPPSAAPTAGRYRILRPHARGGLGEVSVAEDTELGRHIALKEIQARHADRPDHRQRFVLEAEITGGLEHPGIVPVYGLGAYADGRPYYAMRFIQGDNLQTAIRRFHGPASGAPSPRPPSPGFAGEGPGVRELAGPTLTPSPSPTKPGEGRKAARRFDSLAFRQLLGRFVDVCQAVAYAHSRGVLHRDLKPGNIMLGKYGETLVVDWGLAKSVARTSSGAGSVSDEPEATLKPRSGDDVSGTRMGQTLGTPAYMSPEQAAGRLDQLGPASDVYSLGATLYELLTGRAPFAADHLELMLEDVRAGRFPPPHEVVATVPRPLEAICLKAMAVKPADRYATAQALAADVERWLADEPVTAYREPAAARAGRWVRKHARIVTGVGAALVVGVIGLGLLALERDRARHAVAEEQIETAKERDEKTVALRTAETRLGQVERGIDILASVFDGLNPRKEEKEGKHLRVLLGERLDHATTQLTGEAVGDPVAVARLQLRLGMAQENLGYAQKAIELFTAARATLSSRLGPDHPDTLTSMGNLAMGYRAAGKLDAALPLYKEALKLRKAKLGADHPDTLTSMGNLATGYQAAGKLDAALPLLEETLTLRKAKLGPDHPDTLMSMGNLANTYLAAKRPEKALPLLSDFLAGQKKQLAGRPQQLAGIQANVALVLLKAGQPAAAEPILRECLQTCETLEPDAWTTFYTKSLLGAALVGQKKYAEAEPLLVAGYEGMTQREAKIPPASKVRLKEAVERLVGFYEAAGKPDEAARWREKLPR